jgi:hypothetical protein
MLEKLTRKITRKVFEKKYSKCFREKSFEKVSEMFRRKKYSKSFREKYSKSLREKILEIYFIFYGPILGPIGGPRVKLKHRGLGQKQTKTNLLKWGLIF